MTFTICDREFHRGDAETRREPDRFARSREEREGRRNLHSMMDEGQNRAVVPDCPGSARLVPHPSFFGAGRACTHDGKERDCFTRSRSFRTGTLAHSKTPARNPCPVAGHIITLDGRAANR